MTDNPIIGREIILHKVAFPENMKSGDQPDKFVAIKIVETKVVRNTWGDGTSYGWKALGDDGRYYLSNWGTFPDDSMTPRWQWSLDKPYDDITDKDNVDDWMWYDVSQGLNFITFHPTWIERLSYQNIIGYCATHQKLYYHQDGGCFYCTHMPNIGLPPVDHSWLGWK